MDRIVRTEFGEEPEAVVQKGQKLRFAHLARRHRELPMADRTVAGCVAIDLYIEGWIAEDHRRFSAAH
jgi:hypothetical protein